MPSFKIPLLSRFKRMFRTQLKPYLVEGKYRVIPAFALDGEDYFMFESTHEVPTGRFFAAMGIYTEMEMNADKEYLEAHCKAMDKLLSDPKKISVKYIMQLNMNLQERLELAPFPDYIYKLASVIFFDKSESLYSYDYDYNKKKIDKWKAAGGSLDFFSSTPLKELVPSLTMPERDSQTYSRTLNLVNETHLALHTDLLSDEK